MRPIIALTTLICGLSLFAEEKQNPAQAQDSRCQAGNDELKRRWAETMRKLDAMEKDWQAKGGQAAAKAEAKKQADEKSAEKDKDDGGKRKERSASSENERATSSGSAAGTTADSGGSRRRIISYAGHSIPEGGWMDVSGVTSGTNFGSRSGFGSIREGAASSSSISVRATVIRLQDPDD